MSKSASIFLALLMMVVAAGPGQAQDATAGEKVFKKCKACHQIGDNAKNRVGPHLNGIIGRSAGTEQGFKYGASMVLAGQNGLVWDQALIAQYVADPRDFLRSYLDDSGASSRMTFKLKDEQQRLDVAAYLAAATPQTPTAAKSSDAAEPAPAQQDTRTVAEVIADQEFTEAFLSDQANIDAGKELWFGQCTHCHGYKAYPGKAPKLKPRKYKPTFVFKRTYKGFKKMPSWRETFTIDEIRQIVTYVKSSGFAP